MARNYMMPWQFGEALVKAGFCSKEDLHDISRVVIDCQMDRPVEIYIQKLGDRSALENLVPMLTGLLRPGNETAEVEPHASE